MNPAITHPGVPMTVRGVHKRFGAFTALDNVSLDVAAGELVCLLGPSGCGKTTLLRCIAGLERQDKGELTWAVAMFPDWRRRPGTTAFCFSPTRCFPTSAWRPTSATA